MMIIAKNMDFLGIESFKEWGADVPIYILEEKSPDEWNQAAVIQNTNMFSEVFGRQPADYSEVRSWMNSLQDKQKCPGAATPRAFV